MTNPLATNLTPKNVRRHILEQSRRANVGHIGSCLCVVEILYVLFDRILRIPSPDDADRDRFVLSKGHAALTLYAILFLQGRISQAQLDTFCGEGSLLGVHPECQVHGIDFSSGSLGQGLCLATGAALAAKLQGSKRRVYCVVSDAECNEGSIWEAVMFSAHHRLDNLTVIVDINGQQAMGRTCEVLDIPNFSERWNAFGWRVTEVDGHSCSMLAEAICERGTGQPHVVLAKTVFGRGASYMEAGKAITQTHLPDHPINWHYLPMSATEFDLAMSELERSD